MNTEVLVMMRSGRDYRLVVSDEDYAALIAHKDIGANRVFTITKDSSKPVDTVPWNKFFPGVKLYRLAKDVPKVYRPRARKERHTVLYGTAPVGRIGFYSGPINEPIKSARKALLSEA